MNQDTAPILHCPQCTVAVPKWPCPHAKFDVIMADPPWPYDSPRALVGNGGRGVRFNMWAVRNLPGKQNG
jgi:hypothetical protein